MKIALAQINTQIGHLERNVQKVLHALQRARKDRADLVLFPELTLTGYPPQDLLEQPSFIEANLNALQEIVRQTRDVSCLVGFAEPNPSSVGKPLFNSIAWIGEQKIQGIKRKSLLPNYDVFSETRYFEPAKDSAVWTISGHRVQTTICEEIWSEELFSGRKLYEKNPLLQTPSEPQLFLNLSASPYSIDKQSTRLRLIANVARQASCPAVYLNLVGGNDELVFDGGSFVVNAQGELAAKLKSFEEDYRLVDLDHLDRQPISSEEEIEKIYKALVLGTRDYLEKSGFEKVVLGLSGGVDSALVAALATEACGRGNVLSVALPSRFSSEASLTDAAALARNLSIEHRVIAIDSVFESFLRALDFQIEEGIDLAIQNLQARVRGNLLMAISNRERRLLLSTGNKSEIALGYCTLYGDMAGGLSVISDLTKTRVYALCRHINRHQEIIPQSILVKPPSAELAPNQKDQDDLPPYEILDPILERHLEQRQSLEQIVSAGFKQEQVREILERVQKSEYKRKQAAPGLKITEKAFGIGRRFPLTGHFPI